MATPWRDEDLQRVYCTTGTTVRLWSSEEQHLGDRLDLVQNDETFQAKLSSVRNNKGFTLISCTGDPTEPNLPISVSKASFGVVLTAFGLPKYSEPMFRSQHLHLSSHTQYDPESGKPSAFVLLMRLPRNSRSITCIIRVRLSDQSTLALLTASEKNSVEMIRQKCVDERESLRLNPLSLLTFILEERRDSWRYWFNFLYKEVRAMESVTGMVRNAWRIRLNEKWKQELEKYDALLKQLHVSNASLGHCATVMKFTSKLTAFCRESAESLDRLLNEANPQRTKESKTALLDRISFSAIRLESLTDEVSEMQYRVRGQINVVSSLIVQRDSQLSIAVAKDSRAVAELAARDSETMKTITIMTLLFLPTTLVAVRDPTPSKVRSKTKLTIPESIWDAGVILLNDETSWKVFLGTSIALTVVVFASWLLYHLVGRKQRIRKDGAEDEMFSKFEQHGLGRTSPLAQELDWAGKALEDPHFSRSRYPSAEIPRDERIEGRW